MNNRDIQPFWEKYKTGINGVEVMAMVADHNASPASHYFSDFPSINHLQSIEENGTKQGDQVTQQVNRKRDQGKPPLVPYEPVGFPEVYFLRVPYPDDDLLRNLGSFVGLHFKQIYEISGIESSLE